MELNDGNLQTLSGYLLQTLSPDAAIRKPAEKFLESVEANKNYPLLLLHLVNNQEIDLSIRTSGAIAFKNFIKRNWEIRDDEANKIHEEDRQQVKAYIVDLMLGSPRNIQKQLSDAISIIGKFDFPSKWQDLLTKLSEKCQSTDFNIINGVMHTAHSLFKRYRYEFKSQELWIEIKFVLDGFAKTLTELFSKTVELTAMHKSSPDALRTLYSTLTIMCKVFHSLNYQDLPEHFEDNISLWMGHFHTLLNVQEPSLETEGDEEVGIMHELKSEICDNIALYARKYDEEFCSYLPGFVTDIWSLLIATGPQPKFDLLVSNALQFLASVADRHNYSKLFEDANALSSICEKVVIPNMEFRVSDEELFEDNPEEYIRRDIEGSDVDTRRRAACDLVRALSRYFEAKMTEIFSNYVMAMLAKYAEQPNANWKCKDSAIYMVTSLAAKGQTQRSGITQINELVDLTDFCAKHIIPELDNPDVNQLPVIKADCIKYLMIFRSQMPGQVMLGVIPKLVNLLRASPPVVHNYAAITIEKILLLRGPDNVALVSSELLAPVASQLFANLFAVTSIAGAEENEYAMKAVMRSFSTLQDKVIPFLPEILTKLTERLAITAKNPSKPHFNHYLFETLSLAIRIVCKSNPEAVPSFEQVLFPIFQDILQQDVQEFVPYVFQLLSLLLELRPPGNIPEPYMALFPCLLMPVLYERPGNIGPLVRLLQAFISRGATQISAEQLPPLLGIFQKLIASKANDHEGFYLVQTILEHFPISAMEQYIRQIFLILFQRLSSSKTTKFIKNFIVFLCLFSVKYGASRLVEIVDGLQAQMFGMVLERIIIPDLQKVSGQMEKKIASAGMVAILCDCPPLVDGKYSQFWAPVLEALLKLFELPEDESLLPDDHFIEVDDTPGYQAAYSKLAFAGDRVQSSIPDINNPQIHLANCLQKLTLVYPGRLGPIISQGLQADAQLVLNRYLQLANVSLS
ncbi:exportin-2 [Neocloeon triangulifer]|uniref:exportin-2 n=1 Tax=Neocloeon triangulifer TaxID=2078957 RepID=UPI00286F5F1E|nr:exportin-2 [Neocloeon triangulifer]XP_059485389.1 exportin-2 [Neocloeon triangulifer]